MWRGVKALLSLSLYPENPHGHANLATNRMKLNKCDNVKLMRTMYSIMSNNRYIGNCLCYIGFALSIKNLFLAVMMGALGNVLFIIS